MTSPWSQHLIEADTLNSAQKNVVIIDCRFDLMNPGAGRELYAQAHIPGAHYLDLNQDLSSPIREHGGRHPFPDISRFIQRLRDCGVNEDTLIVAYDDNKAAFAARLWYLCHFVGHSQVRILNGGFSAWKKAGFSITAETPATLNGNIKQLAPTPIAAKILDYPQTRALSQQLPENTVLVDSREEPRYLGLQEPIDPIAGHIPGALNLPWMQAVDAEGRLLPEAQQRQRWERFAPENREVVVYCGSGVTACVNLLSLALAGFPPAALYAGSWSDWCSYQK